MGLVSCTVRVFIRFLLVIVPVTSLTVLSLDYVLEQKLYHIWKDGEYVCVPYLYVIHRSTDCSR